MPKIYPYITDCHGRFATLNFDDKGVLARSHANKNHGFSASIISALRSAKQISSVFYIVIEKTSIL